MMAVLSNWIFLRVWKCLWWWYNRQTQMHDVHVSIEVIDLNERITCLWSETQPFLFQEAHYQTVIHSIRTKTERTCLSDDHWISEDNRGKELKDWCWRRKLQLRTDNRMPSTPWRMCICFCGRRKNLAGLFYRNVRNCILDVKRNPIRNHVKIQVVQYIQWDLDNSAKRMDMTKVKIVPNILGWDEGVKRKVSKCIFKVSEN
jgi:hypothetical protein